MPWPTFAANCVARVYSNGLQAAGLHPVGHRHPADQQQEGRVHVDADAGELSDLPRPLHGNLTN
jgi:hypothetical protein